MSLRFIKNCSRGVDPAPRIFFMHSTASLAQRDGRRAVLGAIFHFEVLRVGVAGHVVVAKGVAALDALDRFKSRRWRRGGAIS